MRLSIDKLLLNEYKQFMKYLNSLGAPLFVPEIECVEGYPEDTILVNWIKKHTYSIRYETNYFKIIFDYTFEDGLVPKWSNKHDKIHLIKIDLGNIAQAFDLTQFPCIYAKFLSINDLTVHEELDEPYDRALELQNNLIKLAENLKQKGLKAKDHLNYYLPKPQQENFDLVVQHSKFRWSAKSPDISHLKKLNKLELFEFDSVRTELYWCLYQPTLLNRLIEKI